VLADSVTLIFVRILDVQYLISDTRESRPRSWPACERVYLAKSRERNNRSHCRIRARDTRGAAIPRARLTVDPADSPRDTDRPGGVNSSEKQSCVNSILPVQCPAASAPRRPWFPFCATRSPLPVRVTTMASK